MISSHSLHQAGDAFTQVQTAFVLFQFGKASNGMEWTRRGFERRRSGHSIPVFFGYEALARSKAEERFGISDLYKQRCMVQWVGHSVQLAENTLYIECVYSGSCVVWVWARKTLDRMQALFISVHFG